MKSFSELKKNLKRNFSGLKSIKVALLGDTATQFLQQALRGTGYDYGYDLQIFEADFNQIERQVFDPSSELYEFKPEIVIIFQSTHKLNSKYSKLKPDYYGSFADTQLEIISNIRTTISSNLNAKIIFYNFPEIDDSVFGNYANKTEISFLFQLRKLNYQLMVFASQNPDFYICDLSSIQNQFSKSVVFQTSIYINTEMVLSIDILPEVAAKTLDTIGAMNGRVRKCLIIDLDNTMWGGIIGDDGLENIQLGTLGIGKAFTELQYWIKKLKNRGVILAICSKNTESIAKEPFEKHPDMVLHLDDIAVFVANWENKVDNIKKIQSTLNIGFDSMVFLDDNPFERNIVRENIAGIVVPELPVDPADYLEYLYTLNLFDTVSYSNEDTERTKQYQTEAKRLVEQSVFVNEGDFLKSLNMLSLVEPFNNFNTPRVAQLSQRSNQFNLRTVRYTEADIEKLSKSDKSHTLSFTLEDKFGDNGLICVVILEKESTDVLFIDTWFMSCRVLKRGMENFVLNTLVAIAKENGFKYLKGEYIPTPKNEMVKNHYLNLGFISENDNNVWLLDVNNYSPKKNFINTK
ncbi:HAD-IIIC family phosphatase [Mucilaginibacter sp. X5P1]|uniref:HAD-IIIC family phosphatase n=1 Tax=Mucilaginibacter sp. X5P1 TaxID=2723088 RepID=UPI00161F67C5|nr:HAD-IIIC family phosphatase [Mucilaginibacter sp. X5P1]MBB6141473.1 FkbH-like protein [Mucilaginibacter sp. X5P1]